MIWRDETGARKCAVSLWPHICKCNIVPNEFSSMCIESLVLFDYVIAFITISIKAFHFFGWMHSALTTSILLYTILGLMENKTEKKSVRIMSLLNSTWIWLVSLRVLFCWCCVCIRAICTAVIALVIENAKCSVGYFHSPLNNAMHTTSACIYSVYCLLAWLCAPLLCVVLCCAMFFSPLAFMRSVYSNCYHSPTIIIVS